MTGKSNNDNKDYAEEMISNKEGGGTKVNKCSLKFIPPKEKDVELVREDGSKEIIKLLS